MNTKLIRKSQVAENTMAFYFEKPASFVFKAGQSVDLSLASSAETDEKGNTRPLSIASAPAEGELLFATRIRGSAFKRALAEAPLETEAQIEGPFGSFTLHKNPAKPALLFAGGIGITPFLSMIADAIHDKLPHSIYLFYSNRRPEDAAFVSRLQELATHNANFHFVPTMTEMEKSGHQWSGERGMIDAAMLARHVPSLENAISYLAGPPAMVAAMRQMLMSAGVDEDDIRSEEFSGY